jgi:SAM-dependent methyltransferase
MTRTELYDRIYFERDSTDDEIDRAVFALPKNANVLEPGCGTGRVILRLALSSVHVNLYGFEQDEEFLTAVRQKANEDTNLAAALRTGRLILFRGDMLRMDELVSGGLVVPGTFELVVLPVSTIVHIPRNDVREFFSRIYWLLLRGGRFVLDLSHRASRDGATAGPEVSRGRNENGGYEVFAKDEVNSERTWIRRTFRFQFDTGESSVMTFDGALHSYQEVEDSATLAGFSIEASANLGPRGGRRWLLRRP